MSASIADLRTELCSYALEPEELPRLPHYSSRTSRNRRDSHFDYTISYSQFWMLQPRCRLEKWSPVLCQPTWKGAPPESGSPLLKGAS